MSVIKYKRLNYIETTGTQYIDTKICGSSKNKMELDLQYTELKWQINGLWWSNQVMRNDIGINDDSGIKFWWGCSTNAISSSTQPVADYNRHVFFADCISGEYGIDDTTLGNVTPAEIEDTEYTIYLGARNNANNQANAYCSERIYSAKYYYNDELIADFIPVLDRNNVPCLYDTISQMFFYNKGTGNFIAGEIQENVYYENLIYDRTQADVNYALNNPQSTLFLKGAYNHTDLNRIEAYSEYVAEQLNLYNYSVNITTKTNWTDEDFPTRTEMKRIRDNVEKLKNAFISFTSVPASLEKMTYQKANDLEKVLYELDTLINNMIASFYYSGEVYSGEV